MITRKNDERIRDIREKKVPRFRNVDFKCRLNSGVNIIADARNEKRLMSRNLWSCKFSRDEILVYIAVLYRLWNIQVPMGFFKIKNSFVEEIEKTAFNLHKCFIFKKMPTQEVFS